MTSNKLHKSKSFVQWSLDMTFFVIICKSKVITFAIHRIEIIISEICISYHMLYIHTFFFNKIMYSIKKKYFVKYIFSIIKS